MKRKTNVYIEQIIYVTKDVDCKLNTCGHSKVDVWQQNGGLNLNIYNNHVKKNYNEIILVELHSRRTIKHHQAKTYRCVFLKNLK